MGKHSRKKPQPQDQKTIEMARKKKDLKVFKVPSDLSKKINKKAKKVETKLKKMPMVDRREKVDNQMKNLHESLVVKKPKIMPKMKQTPIPQKTDTNIVESDLEKMQV